MWNIKDIGVAKLKKENHKGKGKNALKSRQTDIMNQNQVNIWSLDDLT